MVTTATSGIEVGHRLLATASRRMPGCDLIDCRLIEADAGELLDRVHLRYRITGVDPDDGPVVVEQHAYLEVEDGQIAVLNLVCSGFRPTG